MLATTAVDREKGGKLILSCLGGGNKGRIVAVVAALCLSAIVSIRPAAAQTDVVIEVPPAEYSFGQHITFHLKATAPKLITEVNLFFRIQGQMGTTAVPISIEPGHRVNVDHPYSLVTHYVPPFATITYWWAIHDEAGAQHLSEEQVLYYADNRYHWRFIEDQRNGISWGVYWVQGDVVFGQTALNVAVQTLDEIYRELRPPELGVIRIFVYPGEHDLRSALSLAGYAWTGGLARPELGAILVGIPDTLVAASEMERLIPHELTHLLVYEASGRTLGRVPPWLNEGLASLYERRPDPDRDALVEQALAEDQLFPLEALCAPFPADPDAARLAYAQSASVVLYLREEYGSQVIRDLIAAYADNASCEAGVSRVLGKDLDGLESAWRARLTRKGEIFLALNDSAVWLSLWLLTALLAVPFLGGLRGADR